MEDITTQNVTEGFGLMYYREASRRGNTRMYDPALGRFTSADTIIPPMQGVQAWDRYAYVNNSPVMYTDPTGHACVNNGGTDDEVAMPGNCGGGANSNYTGGMQGSPGGWTGSKEGTKYHEKQEERPICLLCDNSLDLTEPPPPSGISPATAIQIESYIIGFINDVNDASPLMWRKAFTTAKAFNPNPSIDAGLGAVGQVLEDLSNPNLSFEQRGMRIGIAALESGVTGVVSDVIGVGAAAIVPSPYVYAGAQVVSSVAIDYWVWPYVNQEYLGSDYGY